MSIAMKHYKQIFGLQLFALTLYGILWLNGYKEIVGLR